MGASANCADSFAEPADDAIIGKQEGIIDGLAEPPGPAIDFACQRFLRSSVQSFCGLASSVWIWRETEPGELAYVLALDQHVTAWGDLRLQHGVLPQPPHEHACPPVHEPLSEPFVQSVRQPVLYPTRDILPMAGIAQPARPVGDECPCAHLGDARREGVESSVGAILRRNMAGEPFVRDVPPAGHEAKYRKHEFRMRRRRQLSIVRDLATFPQAGNFPPRLCGPNTICVAR